MFEMAVAQGETLGCYAVTWLGGVVFLTAIIWGVAALSGRCPECRARDPRGHDSDCPFWGM